MNSSKKHDERFWKKWHTAGAVSGDWKLQWPKDNPYSEKELLDFIERTEAMKRRIVEGTFTSYMNTPTHGGRIY